MRLYTEKRDELEEQQRHLHVGLDKLKDTVTQVEQLRKSLAIKRSQLQAKDGWLYSADRQLRYNNSSDKATVRYDEESLPQSAIVQLRNRSTRQ